MEQPLFSIIVPVYNSERFIEKSIDSVLAQTFSNWELILVDDGSTDNSGLLCDKYACRYPSKIKVFHNTNHGQLYSRNFALSKASGLYYIFLDADDYVASNALDVINQTFLQYHCDCVIYGFARVKPNGEIIDRNILPKNFFAGKHSLMRLCLFDAALNPLWCKAIKFSLLPTKDYSAFYHIRHGEDLLQSLEILRNCQTAVSISDILYYYCQNEFSITHQVMERPLSFSFEIRAYVLKFLEKEAVFTAQDMQDYHDYCVKLFEKQIKNICLHPAPLSEKTKLCAAIKRDPYYTDFLVSSMYKQPFRPVYILFRLGLYHVLIILVCSYGFLRRGKSYCTKKMSHFFPPKIITRIFS